ncbi:hypothetical protein [Bacillus thuringiensis]|nr:hypothetical protein [Bacillus thuringiensis]
MNKDEVLEMKFLLIKCIKEIIINGGNEDGTSYHCFVKGKEFLTK